MRLNYTLLQRRSSNTDEDLWLQCNEQSIELHSFFTPSDYFENFFLQSKSKESIVICDVAREQVACDILLILRLSIDQQCMVVSEIHLD